MRKLPYYAFIGAMLLFITVGTSYSQDLDYKKLEVRSQLQSLTGFDGLKYEIEGPMGLPVPKSYFTKNMSSNLKSGELYHTVFKINMNEMAKNEYVAVLYNTLKDGAPYPVVISVKSPDGKFKNYVANFGPESDLAVDLSNEFNLLSISAEKRIAEKNKIGFDYDKSQFVVYIMSDFSFSGELYKNDLLSKKMKVAEPKNDTDDESRATSCCPSTRDKRRRATPCCPSTYGTRIGMWVRKDQSGVCWYAWFKVYVHKIASIDTFTHKYYGDLTWYYPTSQDIFHQPYTPLNPPFNASCTVRYRTVQADECLNSQRVWYTYYVPDPSIKFTWEDIEDIVDGNGLAYGRDTRGDTYRVSDSFWNCP